LCMGFPQITNVFMVDTAIPLVLVLRILCGWWFSLLLWITTNRKIQFRSAILRIKYDESTCLSFQLNENLEQWPHLNELVQCYKADFVKDDCKYGHYESVAPPSFQNQIFEGPDTDMETGNPPSFWLN
jgi:hypothetical protein